MNHSIKKVLLSQDEYQRLLDRTKPFDAAIRLQEINSNMIKDKIIKKNNEAVALKKLDEQIQSLTPIKTQSVNVPPSLSQSVNLPAQTTPQTTTPSASQPSTNQPSVHHPNTTSRPVSPTNSRPVSPTNMLSFLQDNTNKTNRPKVLRLYNLLRQNPSVRVTRDKIYVDNQVLPNAPTLEVLKHLVGRAANLKYSTINPLLEVLSNQNVKGIIQNKKALTMLAKTPALSALPVAPLKTSTPKRNKSQKAKTDESDVFFSQDSNEWEDDDDNDDGNDADDDEPTLRDEKGYGKIKPRWISFWN